MGLRGRGFDSSGQALAGRGGRGEGVGSLSSKKTCQQNKILTNDGPAGLETPPPAPAPTSRPLLRLPVLGWKNAAGRHCPPKGPEAGGARVPGPRGRTPAARRPLVQSIDTALRGEGAPSFSRARQPGLSGPRPSLAFDLTPGLSAARGSCTPEGGCGCWKEWPVGGRIGRRGRRRSPSRTQVAGAGEWSGGRALVGRRGRDLVSGLALGKRGDPLIRAFPHRKTQKEPGVPGKFWTQPNVGLRPDTALSPRMARRANPLG